MKLPIITCMAFAAGIAVTIGFSFTRSNPVYEIRKSTAEVEQVQGFFVFINSIPVAEYEYLGTVDVGWPSDEQFTGVRDNMLKRCRKKYPEANGAILHFNSGGTDKCDAIKFKEQSKE